MRLLGSIIEKRKPAIQTSRQQLARKPFRMSKKQAALWAMLAFFTGKKSHVATKEESKPKESQMLRLASVFYSKTALNNKKMRKGAAVGM